MFPDGSYWPSMVEVTLAVGTVSTSVLIFLVLTKLIPIVELPESEDLGSDGPGGGTGGPDPSETPPEPAGGETEVTAQ